MLATRFIELVGCATPIQLAGMGAVATPELVAAVSNAGGLGMLGTARPGLSVATLTALLDQLRDLTVRPFGVNFVVEPGNEIDRKCFETAAKAARVVEFFYGEPDPELVAIVHDHGSLACWQSGSHSEAVAAAKARCDLIVAQGTEAGGHVRGRIGLQALLAEVCEAVDLPVTFGTPEDLRALNGTVGMAEFADVLDHAPPGIFDQRSWAYWDLKCGRSPAPPMPVRRGLEPLRFQR